MNFFTTICVIEHFLTNMVLPHLWGKIEFLIAYFQNLDFFKKMLKCN